MIQNSNIPGINLPFAWILFGQIKGEEKQQPYWPKLPQHPLSMNILESKVLSQENFNTSGKNPRHESVYQNSLASTKTITQLAGKPTFFLIGDTLRLIFGGFPSNRYVRLPPVYLKCSPHQ